MKLEERITAFGLLGDKIRNLDKNEFNDLASRVENNNNWFTPDQTKAALNAWALSLEKTQILSWLGNYHLSEPTKVLHIGIMMAGNVPAVGFHDVLCVLITGHHAAIKLSSSDSVTIKWLLQKLIDIEPRFESFISYEEMLKGKDAYIATGSDNSARYFDFYFGKYPHIIRKNRTSIAVLNGSETKEDYLALGQDIFQYFGMGCRNVSKIYLPKNSDLYTFLDSINGFHFMASHHKYLNNYDYNKSIFLVNQEDHLDNGFLLLKESGELVSPIGVLFYEYYDGLSDLNRKLKGSQDKIQCIVSKGAWLEGSFDFGQAQCPLLGDFADGVDTIQFLKQLQ